MTITIVELGKLRQSDRWNVESHAVECNAPIASAHPMIALGELVRERRAFLDPQQFADHRFRYVGLEHVTPDSGDLVGEDLREGRRIRSRSKVFRVGDILFGRLRPALNKVVFVEPEVGDGICSGEFHVLVPRSDRVQAAYLRVVLASAYVTSRTPTLLTGSALPRLALPDLLALEVPLPPDHVQRRIAALARESARHRRRWRAGLAQAHARVRDAILETLAHDAPLPDYEQCAGDLVAAAVPAPGLPTDYAGDP